MEVTSQVAQNMHLHLTARHGRSVGAMVQNWRPFLGAPRRAGFGGSLEG